MIYQSTYKSPFGNIIIASNGEALTGLWFENQKYFGSTLPQQYEVIEAEDDPVLKETVCWLDIYFQGKEPNFMPNLALETTPFRKEVAEIMLTIPYGQIMTYGEIAAKLAEQKGLARMSAQAVGGAVGHNPISIIVPCHRVVGTNGSLTGYAGGIEKKIALLELEKAEMSGLFIPKKGTAL